MSTFTYGNNRFYLDGEPFTVLSGAIHYFRVPREYWYDRLLKLKECGLNTVETYVCWNLHEKEEGVFDFDGMLDISEFIKTASELGLYVILRPGPFICAEWDFGGFPAWLLTYKDMELRTNDALYLSKVKRFFTELFKRIRHHFSGNGGNIIMVQIENEYGSYGNDLDYLNALKEMYEELGVCSTYFTSDGPSFVMMTGGSIDHVLSVGNFGSKPKERMPIMNTLRPGDPLMCGEYWCGWFSHWGEEPRKRPYTEIAEDINDFFDLGASFNIYMFHGGTNFGFLSGANTFNGPTAYDVTSYDYGSPVTEAGDRTPMYYAIREVIEKRTGYVPPLTAKESVKKAYGKVTLTEKAELFDNLDNIGTPHFSPAPKFMEDYGQSFGYILYRSTIKGPLESMAIDIDTVRDRAHVYFDGEYKATYDQVKSVGIDNPAITRALNGGESINIDILCDNMGRTNYGPFIADRKGVRSVRFGWHQHFGWTAYTLPMDNLGALSFEPTEKADGKMSPCFYRGYFDITDTPCDTFLRLDGFTKGFVTVNGFNLGRYWKIGPQQTLYVPAPMLKQGKNEIIVFESDRTESLEIEFVSEPILDKLIQ